MCPLSVCVCSSKVFITHIEKQLFTLFFHSILCRLQDGIWHNQPRFLLLAMQSWQIEGPLTTAGGTFLAQGNRDTILPFMGRRERNRPAAPRPWNREFLPVWHFLFLSPPKCHWFSWADSMYCYTNTLFSFSYDYEWWCFNRQKKSYFSYSKSDLEQPTNRKKLTVKKSKEGYFLSYLPSWSLTCSVRSLLDSQSYLSAGLNLDSPRFQPRLVAAVVLKSGRCSKSDLSL